MPTLLLGLEHDDVARLRQTAGVRASRSFPLAIDWHDTPDRALAGKGLALSRSAGVWRLEALRPVTAGVEPFEGPGSRALPMPALPDGDGWGARLTPKAHLRGRQQTLRWAAGADSVVLRLTGGTIQQGPAQPVCRLALEGEAAAIAAFAAVAVQGIGLHVPRATMAAEALAAARGAAPEPRALGAPVVRAGQAVADSLAFILSHLLDVMVHWAQFVPGGHTPEPVHQLRVATRRLRSALSVYRRAVPSPELGAVAAPLRACAARLGAARDWDVFLGGLGARLAAAFPDDRRCRALMRAAVARRRTAYAELGRFLAGPEFRALTVALLSAATLRPWDAEVDEAALRQDTAEFAEAVLVRRAKRVRQAGRGLSGLHVPALHELRKDCKRLRYAAEFFSPLFTGKRVKRYLAALSDLQEELGLLNDGAAASGLMAQLGRLERGWAAGVVEGYSAASAGPARARIGRAWSRFRNTAPFWD